MLEGMLGRSDRALVFVRAGFTGTALLELGDIRAGSECERAFTAQNDAANRGIGVELRHCSWNVAPHVAADRVAARRIVEHHAPDRTVALHTQPRLAHRYLISPWQRAAARFHPRNTRGPAGFRRCARPPGRS